MKRFLNEKEVSEIVGLSVPTLRRWRKDGYGPAWVKVGTHAVRYNSAVVDSWVEETTTGKSEVAA